jgi:hypothetical protein
MSAHLLAAVNTPQAQMDNSGESSQHDFSGKKAHLHHHPHPLKFH